jgi:Helicase conserved C-terminal domain/SNF2-related domain
MTTLLALKPKASQGRGAFLCARLSKRADRVQPDLFGGAPKLMPDKEWRSHSQPAPATTLKPAAKPGNSKLPPNTHWITLHPHGGDEGGARVLIRENKDGTGSVVAGAGGKLNYLHLNRLKSPEEWKKRSKQRAKDKQEKEATRQSTQSEDQKQSEVDEKLKAKAFHQTLKHKNAIATLDALDEHGVAHGLTDAHREAIAAPPKPDATPEELQQRRSLSNEAVKQVRQIQQAYEHKLVTDHEARSAALLGDVPLSGAGNAVIQDQEHIAADANGNAIATLQQLPNGQWLAQPADPDQPSQAFDSWKEAAKAHVRNVNLAEQDGDGDRTQPDDFYDPRAWVKTPTENLPEGFEFKPEAAAAIAKLSAERKQHDKNAKAAEKAIEQGNPFAPAYQAKHSAIEDKDVLAQLESEAKTLEDATTNNRFLNLVDQNDAKQLRSHVQRGGYGALAEIASDVLKQNPVSPDLVKAIGHNETAKVLAYQMRQVLSPKDYDRATAAQAALHAQNSSRIGKAVTAQVKPMVDRLSELHQRMLELEDESGGDYTPDQQIELDNLNYQAEQLHDVIHKQLGEAIGKLQASAAVVAALEGKPNTLRISGDSLVNEDGESTAFDRYNLQPEDYQLIDDGQTAKINESGIKKMAIGYSSEDKEAYDQAIAIKRGDLDEQEYLPAGFAYRPTSTFSDPTTDAQQFDVKLAIAPDMTDDNIEESLKGYIGARVANGENPLDVMTDVRSPSLYLAQGLDPYGEQSLKVQAIANGLVQKLAAESGDDKGRISDRSIRQAFQDLGDQEAVKQRRSRQTDDIQALNSQTLDPEVAIESAHRSLAAMPLARVAFKSWDETTAKERKMLRDYAITDVLGQELEKPNKKQEAEPETAEEVQADLFGGFTPAAEVAAGQQESEGKEYSQWQNFSKLMGGDDRAYAAVVDRLRGKFLSRFSSAYGAIAGKPLLTGGENIAHVDRLLLAKMPEDQRNEMLEFMRSRDASDVASSRSRSGGKFARELDDEWLQKYEDIKGDNRQISLLTSDEGSSTDKNDYQRVAIGAAVEKQLKGLIERSVIPNFNQINQPVKVYDNVSWGADTPHVSKQRASKFIQTRGKVGIHFSAGSGKSSVALGAFSDLHAQGKVKRAIVAVPSAILGQFVGEAASFMKAGAYNYSANLGWGREKRIAALKDPDLHIHVTTRESLTNDLLHLVEKHEGVTPEEFRGKSENDRHSLLHKAMVAEGIDPSSIMTAVDEAQDVSARGDSAASKRSLVMDSLAYHTPYYVEFTGTPVKNNLNEAYSFLHRMAPEKFNDEKAFIAQYGGGTGASRRALQRSIAPYTYAASTKPRDSNGRTLQMRETQPKVQISEAQAKERSRILDDYKTVAAYYSSERKQVMAAIAESGESRGLQASDFKGAWDKPEVREAIDRLASAETFGNLSEEQRKEAIGGQVMGCHGIKEKALWRLYHLSDYANNPKAQYTVEKCKDYVKGQGKSGVVFSSSSKGARLIADELNKQGVRAGVVDGSMNAEQKTKERLKFSPVEGEKQEYDVLVCTNAFATGANLQKTGKFLIHYDTPQTAKDYEQRSARIHRFGQDQDTDVITPQLDVPEEAIAWGRVQRKAGLGQIFQSRADLLDDSGLAGAIEQGRHLAA